MTKQNGGRFGALLPLAVLALVAPMNAGCKTSTAARVTCNATVCESHQYCTACGLCCPVDFLCTCDAGLTGKGE